MFANYLKTAVRNLLKYRVYSCINVLGLAIGIACCILILLYVANELSYDRHHENADRVYRMAADVIFGGNDMRLAVAPAPMAQALIDDYPEVVNAVRFREQGNFLIKKEQQNFKEERVVFADNSVFQIFTIPIIDGDQESALAEPNAVAISRTTASKFFGSENAIGKSLIFDNTAAYKITAVYEDMPDNSHFHFDFIASMETLPESRNGMWLSNNFVTYLLLQDGADPQALEAKFPGMVEKYMGPQIQQLLGVGLEEFRQSGSKVEYYLQALPEIHLHSDLIAEFEPNGNIDYVYVFSAIAVLILLIACINFMNLSTARSANRAKEVGIRKVVGSYQRQLIGQFLVESFLMTLLSLMLAVGLVKLALPAFNNLAELKLEISYLGNWHLLATLAATVLFVGLVAGSYPAFMLSGFKPVTVLKGKVETSVKSGKLRSVLVVFQFAASVILIVGAFTIRDQLRYIQNKTLGFEKEQVVVLHDAYALDSELPAFKNEVLRNPEILSGTISGFLPTTSSRSNTAFWPEGKRSDQNAVSMQIWSVDYDYVRTMGMQIVDGRDFSEAFGTDSTGIILNETAAELFEFTDPVGKSIYTFGFRADNTVDPERTTSLRVVGVVKDFHFESLRENIGALGFYLGQSRGFISFRFTVGDVSSLISYLETKWQEFAPEQPFAYTFLDDRFSEMYKDDKKVGEIFGVFSSLAILTACLGLFGLASFTAEQRTKEIGIRKVLGASVPGIVFSFSREFVKFVLISGLIACPIAWYLMREWLVNFAYRTEVGIEVFVVAIGAALVISVLTVSFQAIRAGLTNPVESLRYE